MDDDELCRGKPTNHIQFNVATAILAGDALLSIAFEVVTQGDFNAEIKVQLVERLAVTSAYKGIVGGQQADIDGEELDLELADIESIHRRKTGALIEMASVSSGLIEI